MNYAVWQGQFNSHSLAESSMVPLCECLIIVILKWNLFKVYLLSALLLALNIHSTNYLFEVISSFAPQQCLFWKLVLEKLLYYISPNRILCLLESLLNLNPHALWLYVK